MKIAIIGAGNMGGSIARGLAKGSLIDDSDIIVSNPSAGKLEKLKKEFPGISTTNNNLEAATGADIVILAVKPWFMESVMRELKLKSKQILISVAAGISFEELAHYVVAPEMAMFRLIPHTAISELESMTLVAARNTNDEQDKFILRLFSEMGTVMLIPEDKIAAATALTSCGIAYVLKYVQAAMQAGIEMGLRPKDAMQMIAQSLKGAAALIQNNDTLMLEKIQSSLVNTIPLWKSQMVLSLGLEHSRQATAAQSAVTNMTNELLKKNADMLKMGTIETAREAERSVVDIQTLQHTNEQLISTLDEVMNIQREGAQKRREAEAELGRIEGQLKQNLLELRG